MKCRDMGRLLSMSNIYSTSLRCRMMVSEFGVPCFNHGVCLEWAQRRHLVMFTCKVDLFAIFRREVAPNKTH